MKRGAATPQALFADRDDAGGELAARVARWFQARPERDAPVVLALPRGGAPIGLAIARALRAPLGLALVRKLGAPGWPELAIGAVVDGDPPTVVRNDDLIARLDVSEAAIAAATRSALAEIARRRRIWLGDRPAPTVAGRDAVVADDGAATGATAAAALTALRRAGPRTLIFAAPVASRDAIRRLDALADATVTLAPLEPVSSIGERYGAFPQLSDEAVAAALAAAPSPGPNARDRR